jgi:DcmR-like sensory protein
MANLSHITCCGLSESSGSLSGCTPATFIAAVTSSLRRWCRTLSRACERCLWVTAPLLPTHEAVQALRAACDDVDDAIQAGALRILDSARLKGLDVVQFWLDEGERALAEGYNGLRIAGNTRFLTAGDWSTFVVVT